MGSEFKLFLQKDLENLLSNKYVVIIGSSVQRSMYKDVVKLLRKDNYLGDDELRAKGEYNFEDDELIEGGRKCKMSNTCAYREVREYKTDYHLVRFYFITRCYNKYVESILEELRQEPQPDVIIVNSCLWDITRYGLGPDSVECYRNNVHRLLTNLKQVLPTECLVLWNSTLPVDKEAKGGVFIPEVESAKTQLGVKILACNLIAHHIVAQYQYDFIDLHYFLRHHLHRRAEDGVHWDMTAHRRMTNLIMCHIAEAWGTSSSKICVPEKQMLDTQTGDVTNAQATTSSVLHVQNANLKHNIQVAGSSAPPPVHMEHLINIPVTASATAAKTAPSNAGPIKSKRKNKRRHKNKRNMDYNEQGEHFNYNQHIPNNNQYIQNMDFTPDTFFDHHESNNFVNENMIPEDYLFNQQMPQKQFQRYEWQEYPQNNPGFCSYSNTVNVNRYRFQPYNNMHRPVRHQH